MAAQIREHVERLLEELNVSDIMGSELPKGLYLRADKGIEGDCEVKEVYFVDNGLGGVFVITASYIVEATEGTGGRFHSMIETFRVLEMCFRVELTNYINTV